MFSWVLYLYSILLDVFFSAPAKINPGHATGCRDIINCLQVPSIPSFYCSFISLIFYLNHFGIYDTDVFSISQKKYI
jgi:hypothetical protein